ncbi:acetylglutamate kinase [Winogradskyella aurantiaca]|uniref:acetylglutamate kinase n=1 Tax=Winogradskyella aurantiaca TaxID=2219558 RepID=UPI000E1D2C97|nr:acetylglutamate kinase [Winogradskyella aurantiaca]
METLKIVKIGGNIIDNPQALSEFLELFSGLEGRKILVHGGGKLATQLAEQMNISVHMHEGRRITDAATLDLITMVYAGKINKAIVADLQSHGCNAIGFTGADGNTIVARKRPINMVDFGFVGDIISVDTTILEALLRNVITPVFCAITHDKNGQLLNTNADTIASELAIGFSKTFHTELYYCFEKNGVLERVSDEDSVIEHIDTESYQELLKKGIIIDGMLPKLTNCFKAIDSGVHKVCIGKTEMLFDVNSTYTSIQK